ncbi:MAG: cell wall-binding repeat-containing protein, partial [Actinomycetota bacterium]|nr:cell wall-binding repeat-containing protein [Actinomycetota bacterium]
MKRHGQNISSTRKPCAATRLTSLLLCATLLFPGTALAAEAPTDPARTTATSVEIGRAVQGRVETGGASIWYELAPLPGGTYVLEGLESPSSEWLDLYLELYDAESGTLLAADDDSGQRLMPRIIHRARPDARVMAKITARSVWSSGQFSFVARAIDPARLSGTVTGVSNIALPGARVTVYALDEGRWDKTAQVTTPGSGAFDFDLESGTYRLSVTPADRTATERFYPLAESVAHAVDLRLHPGQHVDLASLGAIDWSVLSGSVTDAAGYPAAGITAVAYRLVGDRWTACAWSGTNADGMWQMAVVDGTYRIGYQGGPLTQASVFHPGVDTIEFAEEISAPSDDAVVSSLVSPQGPPTAVDSSTVPRVRELSGVDRAATAVAISRATFPSGADTAIIVTGAGWADGLGAASLAGVMEAPILLTNRDVLPGSTESELRRLRPKSVVIVGGTAAVGAPVEQWLRQMLGSAASISRISGTDRYDTAARVAAATIETLAESGQAWSGDYLVTSGGSFADALSVSPLSAAHARPVLLTKVDNLTEATARFLAGHPGATCVVVGGASAISVRVLDEITRITGSAPTRIAGTDRYATSLAVARYA